MNPEIDQSHNDPCVVVLFSCCVKRVHLNHSCPNQIRSMSISTSVPGGVGGGGGGGGNVSYESYAPHSSGQIAHLNQMSSITLFVGHSCCQLFFLQFLCLLIIFFKYLKFFLFIRWALGAINNFLIPPAISYHSKF